MNHPLSSPRAIRGTPGGRIVAYAAFAISVAFATALIIGLLG